VCKAIVTDEGFACRREQKNATLDTRADRRGSCSDSLMLTWLGSFVGDMRMDRRKHTLFFYPNN
jgi:hypothetical protein